MKNEHNIEDIFCAVKNGDLEEIRRLVSGGIKLSEIPEREVISSSRGYIAEVQSSERRETNDFRYGFVSEPLSTDRTRVEFTESLLDCAVTTGNTELVRFLLEQKCDATKGRALYLATEAKNMEIINLLVGFHANPCKQVYNKFPEKTEGFWYEGVRLQSPLELATETLQEDAVALFLRDKEKLISDNLSTAFRLAASIENENILSSFLDCWEHLDENVFSRVVEKIIIKGKPGLNKLVLTCGAPVEAFSRCLPYALRTADTDAVRLLMLQGIRPLSASEWGERYKQNRKETLKFESWGRIWASVNGFSVSNMSNKTYTNFFDDDYKYLSWTKKSAVSNFSGYYAATAQAPVDKRLSMVRTLSDEGLLDSEELSYLYYLAIAGDDIDFAEGLEAFGAAVTDFEPYATRAGNGKSVTSFSDLAEPIMSKEKAVYICKHLNEGEKLVLGNKYFDTKFDRTEMLLYALDYSEQVVGLKTALFYFYDKESIPGIEKMEAMGALTLETTTEYITRSVEDGKPELTAWFMEYKNKHFLQTQIAEEAEADMWEL